MGKDDNTIGSWGNKPLPYDKDKKEEVSNIIGLVKLTQPDYFLSYLEESGIVPKGYSKLTEDQKGKLAIVIEDWIVVDQRISTMKSRHAKSQMCDAEEESEE